MGPPRSWGSNLIGKDAAVAHRKERSLLQPIHSYWSNRKQPGYSHTKVWSLKRGKSNQEDHGKVVIGLAGTVRSPRDRAEHHWMSPFTHPSDQPCSRSNKKPNPHTGTRRRSPFPLAVSLQRPLLTSIMILTVKEKGLQCSDYDPRPGITSSKRRGNELINASVYQSVWIGIFFSRMWAKTPLIYVPVNRLLLVHLSVQVPPFESSGFKQWPCSYSLPHADSRTFFLFPHGH